MSTGKKLRIVTRGSTLALWQTRHVAQLLGIEYEEVIVTVAGDKDKQSPISQIGGRGVFSKELQTALLDGRADVAVHSAKDLQSQEEDGLVIAAVPSRGDVRDALVGSTLADLPRGATVGTCSIRRRAQLAAVRPDLEFAELRGNMETRLKKAENFGAIVVAAVGLERIGLGSHITEILPEKIMLPQVSQGALAVECRSDDSELVSFLNGIEDTKSRQEVDCERAFLAELGSGCDLPVGARCRASGSELSLNVLLAAPDGSTVLRVHEVGADPISLGRNVGKRLLEDEGGQTLLEKYSLA